MITVMDLYEDGKDRLYQPQSTHAADSNPVEPATHQISPHWCQAQDEDEKAQTCFIPAQHVRAQGRED